MFALRAEAVLTWCYAVGFGLATLPVAMYLIRRGRLPTFFDLFEMYGGPWSERVGRTAFVALLMGLCNQRFTATHYAMLSAFAAVGRIYVSPLSGVLSQSIGWPAFFLFSIVVAVPGVVMVWWLRDALGRLGRPQIDGVVDD